MPGSLPHPPPLAAVSSEPGSRPVLALLAPGGRAGLAVLSCFVSRRGFRMGEGASALQEVEGKLTRLARASKPQITHFIQPKVEETVQVGAWQCHPGLPMRLLPTVPASLGSRQVFSSESRARLGLLLCHVRRQPWRWGAAGSLLLNRSCSFYRAISQGCWPWQEWCGRQHLQDRSSSLTFSSQTTGSSGAVVLGFAFAAFFVSL